MGWVPSMGASGRWEAKIKYSNSSENLIIFIIIFLNLLKYSDIISVSEMYQRVTVTKRTVTSGGESYMEEKAKKDALPYTCTPGL